MLMTENRLPADAAASPVAPAALPPRPGPTLYDTIEQMRRQEIRRLQAAAADYATRAQGADRRGLRLKALMYAGQSAGFEALANDLRKAAR